MEPLYPDDEERGTAGTLHAGVLHEIPLAASAPLATDVSTTLGGSVRSGSRSASITELPYPVQQQASIAAPVDETSQPDFVKISKARSENMGEGPLKRLFSGSGNGSGDGFESGSGSVPDANGDPSWEYVRRGMLRPDTTYRITLNPERVIVASVQDDYPNHPMEIKSAPLAYLQSITMVRHRLLPYSSIWGFFCYFARRIAKVLAAASPYIGLVCAFILFCILWALPDTLIGAQTGLPTRTAVNAAFVFGFGLMLSAAALVYMSGSLGTKWRVGAGVNLMFVLPLFIILAYLVSTAKQTGASGSGSDDGSSGGGYGYHSKLTCNCKGSGGTGGTASGGTPYAFICSPSSVADTDTCYLDSNCGLCGNEFYRGFGASLAFACLALITTTIIAICYWRDKGAKRPHVAKQYCMYVWLHGAKDYGYPLFASLELDQSIALQDRVYAIMKSQPDKFKRSAENLQSSNLKSVWSGWPGFHESLQSLIEAFGSSN